MNNSFTIQELTNFFNLNQTEIQNQIQEFITHNKGLIHHKDNQYLVKKTGIKKLSDFLQKEVTTTNNDLLEFVICRAIEKFSLESNNNFTFQYTKRSKLEQQQNYNKFAKLPEVVKNKYYNFAAKILTWLKADYISNKLTKLIIDRIPKNNPQEKQIDLRITFYKGNQLSDLNLKIANRINNLKKINLTQLKKHLGNLSEIKTKINKLNHQALLNKLEQLLNRINHKRTVQKLFKWLIGFKPYYLIIAEPKIIIADFTQFNLPTKVQADCEEETLVANFNNDCQLTAQLITTNQTPQLTIDFRNLPNQLNLLSF
ncbi:hypothetical protein [Halanaerobaculum tunisiense]